MTTLLTEPRPEEIVVVMLTYSDAIDRYLGDLARRGKAERTRDTYRRTLTEFNDSLPTSTGVHEITKDQVRRYLDRFNHLSAATRAQKDSILRGHFKWLFNEEEIRRSPMERMLPPVRQRDEDKKVVTISTGDVQEMLKEAKGWTEKLALGILAYTGARRSAVSNLRVSDYDPAQRKLSFVEKGNKEISKAVPEPLVILIEESLKVERSMGCKLEQGRWVHRGYRKVEPDDYLVPSATSHRNEKRDSRVIYDAVKRVAKRCEIQATTHAFRAAFAVFYLENKPGELVALQQHMGHQRLETTQTYLRRLNRDAAMEGVRDLDWFANSEKLMVGELEAEKEGFEPSLLPPLDGDKPTHHRGDSFG